MQSYPNQPLSYCNQLALEKGLDPIGHAPAFTDAVVIEVSLPWKSDIYSQTGSLPHQIIDLLTLWRERYQAGRGYPHALFMVAPDRVYSQPGYRYVMYYERPTSQFTAYRKIEYLVPQEVFGKLVWALFEANDQLTGFEQYRVVHRDTTRDILVCTHGSIDIACAKFGHPLYMYLRKNYHVDQLRVWRVSHFGGHIFAPTLVDMPYGHYWAYIGQSQADQIITRSGNVHALYSHYRGWAALADGFLQAAERELWMQYGWDWLAMPKSGTSKPAETENGTKAQIRIDYALPAGNQHNTWTTQVVIHKHILTPHSSASADVYGYPQYHVMDRLD